MSNLWIKNKGSEYITTLQETAFRLEELNITSMRKLVDSLEEQVILEDLIEADKGNFYAPFRNPPLKYGSRFGRRLEPSLWYGSMDLDAALAEKAFYRFNFLNAMSGTLTSAVEIQLTLFAAKVKTRFGIKLTTPPFAQYTPIISSPVSYEVSQELGTAMRHANVEAFTYRSARDPKQGTNIAVYTPRAFEHDKPDSESFQSWLCIANNNLVEFIRSSAESVATRSFTLDIFLVANKLPFPAN